MLRSMVAIGLVALLAGCYSYVPANRPALSHGADVQVQLSTPDSFNLGDITANRIVVVRGELVRWDGDGVVLSAFWLRSASEREYTADGPTVTIPATRVAAVERKRFSRRKTGALAGLGLLFAVIGDFAFGGGTTTPDGNGGSPPAGH